MEGREEKIEGSITERGSWGRRETYENRGRKIGSQKDIGWIRWSRENKNKRKVDRN